MAIETTAPTEVEHRKNYIGGEWVDSLSGEVFDVVNPSTCTGISGRRHTARCSVC
jgi:hypothetical protein